MIVCVRVTGRVPESATESESDDWESARESGWDHLRIILEKRVKMLSESST